ncbi:BNR/Asp-box repeat protein [mine drainage metagenome]|uniref:BNR/Asp-box repeat protein n=1 Tax=mine drainage metagenome TaxID=410659 RepID=A0A1J5Q0N7_9ZZZZ
MSRVRRLWWVIAGVGSVALLGACSANSTGQGVPSKGSSSQAVEADAGMEHIHNLMLADGSLLIGTHEGLWMQQGTSPVARIGKSHFDVMGLARTSDGLVASGHPGEGEEQVNDLGLRGSSDLGKTWNNISLFGKVDFHRLVASSMTVLGISAHDGALLRSDDSGKTWKTLVNPGLYDLAIDPADSSMIVGTAQNGPVRSADGGRTFTAIPGSPLIALLSWDDTRLVGVTPAGVLFESTDKGITWRKIATVKGEPSALSVRGDEIALLTDSTVYYSKDGGITFAPRIVGVMGH